MREPPTHPKPFWRSHWIGDGYDWLRDMDTLLDLFEKNQFASGGFALMVLGALAAFARKLPYRLFLFARRRCIFTIELPFTDPAFGWLKFWLNGQEFFRRRRSYVIDARSGGTDERGEQELLFVPAEGTYLLRHQGRFLIVEFEREELKNAVATAYGARIVAHRETIRLSCLGRQARARRYIEGIILGARSMAEDAQQGKVTLHRPSADLAEWVFLALRSPREVASVVLRRGVLEAIAGDIREFREGAAWYRGMGIPWRRGYLLHGPPGNGKSSLVLTMAGLFELDVYLLDLSNPRLTDALLADLVNSLPEESILVIEDIDAIFVERDRSLEGGVSFSGLLNALDGVGSGEGRLLFMTTNHPERLDPALTRPGRADRHFAIGNPEAEQLERLFLRFFPENDEAAREFARRFLERGPSMAVAQEYLLAHRDSPGSALLDLTQTEVRSSGPNVVPGTSSTKSAPKTAAGV